MFIQSICTIVCQKVASINAWTLLCIVDGIRMYVVKSISFGLISVGSFYTSSVV